MRELLAAAVLISAVPLSTAAAQRNDVVKHRNECRLATQIIVTGHPAPHATWAARKVGSCGAEAGAAIATALRASRASRDLETLGRLSEVSVVLRDGRMFDAALDIIGDAAASPEARVFASRTIILALQPHLYLSYPELADGNCYGRIRGAHATHPRAGTPMPAGFAESSRAISIRVFNDSTAPNSVRRAARCVAIHDAAPFREPATVQPGDEVQVQDLGLAYVCGNTFRVINPYPLEMTVGYRVERSSEKGSTVVPAEGERTITTRHTGRVRLLDEYGVEIAGVANEGRSCIR